MRAGSRMMARNSSKTPSTAMPRMRNGIETSQTSGQSTSATSASGQHSTKRSSQRARLNMSIHLYSFRRTRQIRIRGHRGRDHRVGVWDIELQFKQADPDPAYRTIDALHDDLVAVAQRAGDLGDVCGEELDDGITILRGIDHADLDVVFPVELRAADALDAGDEVLELADERGRIDVRRRNLGLHADGRARSIGPFVGSERYGRRIHLERNDEAVAVDDAELDGSVELRGGERGAQRVVDFLLAD